MNTKSVNSTKKSKRPNVFTRENLDWIAWIEPVAEDSLSERQRGALVEPARAKSDYFRLLARDPDILEARTRTDKDIFYNTVDGLPRAEREVAAAATSRFNGCIYCASVHARHAAVYSKKPADVDELLDKGISADLGERWNAIVSAASTLSQTPPVFGQTEIDALRAAGLDDDEIFDVIHAVSFFNWANRLMLSLGEPELEQK